MSLLGEDGATILGLDDVLLGERDGGNLLTVIPARGGSQRLRRKNLLPLGGIPLFLRAAQAAPGTVIISTDDDEIASMARVRGLNVHRRLPVDSTQTIAEMARGVVNDLAWDGDVLVVQPTVQPLTRDHLLPMVHYGRTRKIPLVASRFISHFQWLTDRTLGIDYELGVYFWPAGRAGDQPEEHYQLGPEDFIDIDTPKDYLAAQYHPAKILIDAATPTHQFGSGHWKRAETLALALQHHEVQVGRDDGYTDWDLVIIDKGDTHVTDVTPHQQDGAKIVTIEDIGSGAFHADLVINSFVGPLKLPTERHGPEWAILRSEFLELPSYTVTRDHIEEVLVVLGGTDARNMTTWVCDRITGMGLGIKAISHKGPGIAEAMYNADLFISGAGRAVQEAAYVGVPTVVIPTTLREATHAHLGPRRGNLVLPVAGLVTRDQVREAVSNLAADPDMREEMSRLARSFVDGKGLARVVHEIEGMLI